MDAWLHAFVICMISLCSDALLPTTARGKEGEMQLTFREPVCPTARQHAIFKDYLRHTCDIYNAALDERINCYQKTGKTLTSYSQQRELTELRTDPEYARFPRRMQAWAIDKVEAAYKGMFTRHKKGAKGKEIGFPSFRSSRFWNAFGLNSPIEIKMRPRGLYNRKVFGGTLRLRPHRELPPWEQCTTLTMVYDRDHDRWFAHLTYEVPDAAPKTDTPKRPVGIDIGLKTLAMRSDGVPMDTPRQSAADTADLRRASRALSRCKKRSKRRRRVQTRLRKVHARIANRRQARLQVIAARLTHHFDAVAVEDLNLKGLTNMGGGGAKGRGVRKSWRDRAPGKLDSMIAWNTQRDGRHFKQVDPRGTTIECSFCGARVPKTLRERWHHCKCGAVLNRDHNAARNACARAGWGPGDVKLDVRSTTAIVSGASLSLKHGGSLESAGPRQGDLFGHPPPSTRGRKRGASG